ncbi:hypothetical protein GCM10009827_087150 [Dactylosporangium maewongense]|uniref:Secreted protein n=1 Tax=Dactylosporangium maewongense TaxID=634393 RepID=A0ABP4N478_9ACTN
MCHTRAGMEPAAHTAFAWAMTAGRALMSFCSKAKSPAHDPGYSPVMSCTFCCQVFGAELGPSCWPDRMLRPVMLCR